MKGPAPSGNISSATIVGFMGPNLFPRMLARFFLNDANVFVLNFDAFTDSKTLLLLCFVVWINFWQMPKAPSTCMPFSGAFAPACWQIGKIFSQHWRTASEIFVCGKFSQKLHLLPHFPWYFVDEKYCVVSVLILWWFLVKCKWSREDVFGWKGQKPNQWDRLKVGWMTKEFPELFWAIFHFLLHSGLSNCCIRWECEVSWAVDVVWSGFCGLNEGLGAKNGSVFAG